MSATPTRVPDNALLQKNILFQLADGPVSSVARLARRMGGSRPSTSRSIHALAEMGFTLKTKGGWMLTEDGYDELRRLEEDGRKPLDIALSVLDNAQLAQALREAAKRLEEAS